MAHHAGIAGTLGQINRFQCFGQGADLVDFHQQRVGQAAFDAFGQNGRVGHEQVVTYQLDAVAQALGQDFPACPVVLAHAIFDGDDRVVVGQGFQVVGKLLGAQCQAFGGQVVLAVFVELAGSAVQGQHHVLAGYITGGVDGFQNQLDGFFVAGQVRGKAAFVAHSGGVTFAITQLFQRVEDLGATAQGFAESSGAYRHDHEFLDIQGVVGVCTTVDHVHHRYRQGHRACTAQVAVQRQAGVFGGRAGHGHGHGQHGVGAQACFGFGAVQLDQGLVDEGLVRGVQADDGFADCGIDVLYRFEYAFAQVAAFVAVTQFQRFFLAGGGAGWYGSTAHHAGFQQYISFNSGVTARVQDFAGNHVDDRTHECFLQGVKVSQTGYGAANLGSGWPWSQPVTAIVQRMAGL